MRVNLANANPHNNTQKTQDFSVLLLMITLKRKSVLSKSTLLRQIQLMQSKAINAKNKANQMRANRA